MFMKEENKLNLGGVSGSDLENMTYDIVSG